MHKSKLIVFGDSWAQGSELGAEEKTFGELVTDQLGFDYFSNYAEPASCIPHLIVKLKSFLKRNSEVGEDSSKFVAVFFLTAEERSMNNIDGNWIFYNASGGFSPNYKYRDAADLTNEYYWKYFYNPEQAKIITNTNIIALQSICQQHGIQDFYIAGWQHFDLWSEVDHSKIYKDGKVSCADLLGLTITDIVDRNNAYIYPNISHPNQQGHQLIADRLVEWISSEQQTIDH